MKNPIKKLKCSSNLLVAAFVLLSLVAVSNPQNVNAGKFEYLSPMPNSSYVSPLNNIIIRYGDQINPNTINIQNLIIVNGSESGLHIGELTLLDDGKTIIFRPDHLFNEGERVTVKLREGLETANGKVIGQLEFEFHISDSWQTNIDNVNSKIMFDEFELKTLEIENKNTPRTVLDWNKVQSERTTPNIPNLYVTISNDPFEGYIFISPWFYQGNFSDPNYIIISDNYGIPVYYKSISGLALDFKVQQNGVLTYYDRSVNKFYAMDSSYNIIDEFTCGNGYNTDFHDLQVLPNNHYLVMSYDAQTVRMDTVVSSGDTAAIVIGLIVQELDQNDNVIFQWRSWDHFQITDASNNINLTAHVIDYVHGNSVEMDYDGNLIISSRHMNEVTKISKATGDIIWRLGGKKNQFQFTNDNRRFAYQHDVRRLENGNVTIFDNANLLWPRYSSSIEYQLDEQNYIATRVWDYSNINHYSPSMGSSTRLPDARTIIGWGGLHNPAVTEVDSNGTKKFEMVFDELVFSYRAFRQKWRTNLITSDKYNVDFGFLAVNDSAFEQIIITNNSNEEKVIDSYFSRTNLFSVMDEFSISLQSFESKIIHIQFSPDSLGVFSDDIHLRIDDGNEMIAQVISVSGFSDPFVPVELKYFNAVLEPGKVRLNWSTASETNNLGFEIEKTSLRPPPYEGGGGEAGGGWKMIGFVKGNGTTTQTNEYFFVDDISDITSSLLYYRLKQIDFDGSYEFSDEVLIENTAPNNFALYQNFPNPFNPSTKIKYSIPALVTQHSLFVQLKIYDVLGNEVATLVNEEKSPGNYEVEFNLGLINQSTKGKLSSGIYFYQLTAGDFISTKKMLMIK